MVEYSRVACGPRCMGCSSGRVARPRRMRRIEPAVAAAQGRASPFPLRHRPSQLTLRRPPPGAPLGGEIRIGSGPVKVALILPMTGAGQGAVVAQSMRNAAELALGESQGPDITAPREGRPRHAGRRAGGRAAGRGGGRRAHHRPALCRLRPGGGAGGARARQSPSSASRPMRASPRQGVYLLSFLVQEEVDRIVSYAASQGRRSIAALIPETHLRPRGRGAVPAGGGAAGHPRRRDRALSGRDSRKVAVQRLARDHRRRSAPGGCAVRPRQRRRPARRRAGAAGVRASIRMRVKPLGTGVWNEPRVLGLPALQGGWFATPDNRGFEAFAERYRARFNTDPIRLATLSYDAVTLAAALARMQGVAAIQRGHAHQSGGLRRRRRRLPLQPRRHQRAARSPCRKSAAAPRSRSAARREPWWLGTRNISASSTLPLASPTSSPREKPSLALILRRSRSDRLEGGSSAHWILLRDADLRLLLRMR